MAYVEILKLQNDGSQQVVATCVLHGDQVECTGDATLARNLKEKGIKDYHLNSETNLYPTDGRVFLDQLKYNFKSGYLNATDIKEGGPMARADNLNS